MYYSFIYTDSCTSFIPTKNIPQHQPQTQSIKTDLGPQISVKTKPKPDLTEMKSNRTLTENTIYKTKTQIQYYCSDWCSDEIWNSIAIRLPDVGDVSGTCPGRTRRTNHSVSLSATDNYCYLLVLVSWGCIYMHRYVRRNILESMFSQCVTIGRKIWSYYDWIFVSEHSVKKLF